MSKSIDWLGDITKVQGHIMLFFKLKFYYMKKYFLFLIVLLMISCESELDDLTRVQDTSGVSTYQGDKSLLEGVKLDNRFLTELEGIELFASKILTFKIEQDKVFRLAFIQSLFTTDGHPKENIFLSSVFNEISGEEIGEFLQVIGKTPEDYDQFLVELNQNYPLLVAKVPLWYGSVWSLSGEDGFNLRSPLLDELRFIPFVEDIDRTNYYNTYKYEDPIIKNEIINSKDIHFDYLPILIRQSEYHRLIDTQSFTDPDGNSLLNSYEIDDDPQSPCYTLDMLLNHEESLVFGNGDYSVVNWISFQQELFKCSPPPTSPPTEDCYNGVDDDDDGLIDCDDPDCDCTEICNNGIDDDGDGLVDAEDSDCCWFYAGCDRDCVAETNLLKGLKFKNNFVGMFHNHDPIFNDITGIRVVTYEFIGSAGAVPSSKNFYLPFMKLCAFFSLGPDIPGTGGLNPDYQAFYSAEWSTEESPPSYLGVSLGNIFGTWYLNLNEPLLVEVDEKWHDNWDGTKLGDIVRGEVFYLSSDVVSTSQSNTYTTETVTELGWSFGVNIGVSGGNPANGVNIGYKWSEEETEKVQSQVTINVSPQDKPLGTFDMNYCESNSFFFETNPCPEEGQILGSTSFNGTYYSTGAMEVWSSIDIE